MTAGVAPAARAWALRRSSIARCPRWTPSKTPRAIALGAASGGKDSSPRTIRMKHPHRPRALPVDHLADPEQPAVGIVHAHERARPDGRGTGDGTVTIAHEDSPEKLSVVQTLKTEPRAKTMALDPRTHKIYLASARFEPAPEPAPGERRQRPKMVPGSFKILVYGM